jgi:hypothetical protein
MTSFILGNNLFNTFPGGSSTDNPTTVSIEWPGGDGWLLIGPSPSFSGGAFFELNMVSLDGPALIPLSPIHIPGVDHINTSSPDVQVFPFSAPKGVISGTVKVSSPGDAASNLNVSAVTIP